VLEWDVGGTDTGSCPVAGFVVSGVEPSVSTAKKVVLLLQSPSFKPRSFIMALSFRKRFGHLNFNACFMKNVNIIGTKKKIIIR
jgi:hypothetical protein